MAIKITLKDLIDDVSKEIYPMLRQDFRKELDKRPHILDISLKALKINIPQGMTDQQFKKSHDVFLSIVRERLQARTYTSLTDPALKKHFAGSTPYIVYIDAGAQQLLAAMSFDAIQKFISDVSKNPKLETSIFGQRSIEEPVKNRSGLVVDTKTRRITNIEIGHIATQGIGGEFLTSPLTEKVNAVIEFGAISGQGLVQKYAEEALDKLYEIQADIEYTFKNTTPEIFDGIENTFGKTAVIVTLHTFNVNQEFSAQEKAILLELERKIAQLASARLLKHYLDIPSSNTILQDIEEGIVSAIKTGKTKLTRHTKKSEKTAKKPISTKQKIPANSGISVNLKQPDITPAETNLTGLQILLNAQLRDTVAGNMGSGNRRDILNYRTGRFAESAEVKRLSISRQGMITAFYDYMRYPYATFSSGGAQEHPRSRDPKVLISKSIREIAAKIVTNRLRAVLV